MRRRPWACPTGLRLLGELGPGGSRDAGRTNPCSLDLACHTKGPLEGALPLCLLFRLLLILGTTSLRALLNQKCMHVLGRGRGRESKKMGGELLVFHNQGPQRSERTVFVEPFEHLVASPAARFDVSLGQTTSKRCWNFFSVISTMPSCQCSAVGPVPSCTAIASGLRIKQCQNIQDQGPSQRHALGKRMHRYRYRGFMPPFTLHSPAQAGAERALAESSIPTGRTCAGHCTQSPSS